MNISFRIVPLVDAMMFLILQCKTCPVYNISYDIIVLLFSKHEKNVFYFMGVKYTAYSSVWIFYLLRQAVEQQLVCNDWLIVDTGSRSLAIWGSTFAIQINAGAFFPHLKYIYIYICISLGLMLHARETWDLYPLGTFIPPCSPKKMDYSTSRDSSITSQ